MTAIADVYRRYYPTLVRRCRPMVGCADAEDIAQDAFVRVLRALPRLGPDPRIEGYLAVVADGLCIDLHRRRRLEHLQEELHEMPAPPAEEEALASAGHAELGAAFLRLSDDHRRVFVLAHRDRWPIRRIARHLQLSPGRVEAMAFAARRALRDDEAVLAAAG